MLYIIKIHVFIYIYSSSAQPDGDGLVSNGFLDTATGPKAIFTCNPFIFTNKMYLLYIIIIIIIIIGYVTSNLDRISWHRMYNMFILLYSTILHTHARKPVPAADGKLCAIVCIARARPVP